MAITKITTPELFNLQSNNTEGTRLPVMTTTQRNAMTGVSNGELIFNSATDSVEYYDLGAAAWYKIDYEVDPLENFNTVLYTGDGSTTRSITGVGFDPDLVWVKKRSGGTARNHSLHDVVRGAGNRLNSNTTSAGTDVTNEVKSFINDGFTIGNGDEVNGSGSSQKYVAWCFKAGGLKNKAADFNGSSSKITLSSSFTSALDVSTKTISTWVNADNVSSGYGMAFSMNATTLSYGRVIFQLQNSNKELTFLIGNSSPYITTTLVPNTWYHIAVSLNGSSFECFVNGTSVGTGTNNNYGDSSGDTTIGAYNASGNPYNWTGKIGQVRFFNSALSASQVTELYNETAANNSVLNYPTGAGCIAAYPLGENANGLDGLYNGTASNVTFGKPGYLTRNNEGTRESTVSVNDNLGFSIVTGSAPINGYTNTFGHGLGQKPDMIITKITNDASDWFVIFPKLSNALLKLNTIGSFTYDSFFEGTSTTLKTGYTTAAFDFVAYCFVSKPGISKVGTYTGNGINNPVDVGFEPAFVMIKNTTSAVSSWAMFDNKRTTANPSTSALYANESINEEDLRLYFQFTSTGFKNLQSSNTLNTSGWIYTYLAFA